MPLALKREQNRADPSSSMGFRTEILRGVRLAAFVFALVLIVLVVRRAIRGVGSAQAEGPKTEKVVIESGSMTPGSNPPPPPAVSHHSSGKGSGKNVDAYKPPNLVRMEPAESVERTAH